MIIEMHHPGLPSAEPVKTTDQAFEKVWQKKGWRRVAETPLPFTPELAATPAPPADPPADQPRTRGQKTEV